MKPRKSLILAIASVAVVAACASDDLITTPGLLNLLFKATLTPAGEVPPVTASSSGEAKLTIIDSNTIRVETKVTGIDSVTQAHIHAGTSTVAGPIMVFLTPTYASVRSVRVARHLPDSVTVINGTLSHVDITRATTFTGVYTFDSVMTRIKNGTAYVNVHTIKNPGGEIRGQLAQ
jgi:CHRD domain-containing protein